MAAEVNRQFKVTGKIECLFTPDVTPTTTYLAGIRVELWQKSPVDVTFLAEGPTDTEGNFDISFDAKSPNVIIENGKINEVFLKVYCGDKLVIGDNPY